MHLIIQFSIYYSGLTQWRKIKGDGNDGEPDALEKLEMEKKAKN